jgi:8-oxo-dGTP pyrophosphatase MutT (NUDIX family)
MSDTARREAIEETAVRIPDAGAPRLVGMDVHGIPARKGEPFHLHHDLIFVFSAESEEFTLTDEAPQVAWCGAEDFARYQLPGSITRAVERSLGK